VSLVNSTTNTLKENLG